MGKKKNKSNSQKTNEYRKVNENKNESESENEKDKENQMRGNGDGENNKEARRITVVLKIFRGVGDGEFLRWVRGLEGVETVNADPETYKLTVVGKVDPMSLRDKLAAKLDLYVELIYPMPKKDIKDDKSDQKSEEEADDKSDQKSEEEADDKSDQKSEGEADDKSDQKSEEADDKNSKEAPPQTAVLRPWGWQEDEIRVKVLETKGVMGFEIDEQKRLLTVTGTMDVRGLFRHLHLQSEPRAWTYIPHYPEYVIHPSYPSYPYAAYPVDEDPNACSIM